MKVFDILQKHVLVTRESAQGLRASLDDLLSNENDPSLDFTGIEAVTPSFVDELLEVLESRTIIHPESSITA